MLRCLLTAIWLATALSSAFAQTCSYSISDVIFGSADTLSGSNTDVTATMQINCSGGIVLLTDTVRLCPNIGVGTGGATTSTRQMISGASKLNYQLYSDPGRTTVWGSYFWPYASLPPQITLSLNLLTGSASTTQTVYARMFGGQSTAPVGTYLSAFSGLDANLTYQFCLLAQCPPCSGSLSGSANASFTVSANILNNCLLQSATDLDFGQKGVIDANVDATNTISVECTMGTAYNIGLNAGNGAGATVAARKMTGPAAATVTYSIYRDAARTLVWGNTINGDTLAGTGNGSTQSITAYGRVPPQVTPAAGNYSDTIVVTVTY